jgi:glycosyltransferase involved in cell wall biosynthesis
MMHVLLSQDGSYREIVEHMKSEGAQVTVIGPGGATGGFFLPGKLAIVAAMFSPQLLRLRGLWGMSDRLVVIGWQAFPVLALIKMGVLPRPAKTVVVGLFVHSPRVRRVANLFIRMVRFQGLSFITGSEKESRELIDSARLPPQNVYYQIWREDLDGRVAERDVVEGNFIFSGGYSNRDYDLLLRAMQGIDVPLVIVASHRNQIGEHDPSKVQIHRDIDESTFERLLAQSRLVVLPLKNQGDGCGHSVLLRVFRNGKPLIVSRHSAVLDYFGDEYAGFVPLDDEAAMRTAISRAIHDNGYRSKLTAEVRKAQVRLDQKGNAGQEVIQFLMA